jgi:hypothetical protein
MGCAPDKHRWEWFSEREGIITYRCINANCGEIREQYIDCGSGC